MKLTIRKKILLCSLVPVCLLGVIVIIIANTLVEDSIINQVKKSLKGTAVATLAAYDQNSGIYLQAENGDIWKGSYNISQSENLVDTIKAESGMDVTFFYGSKRIMTSAFDANNERILGTPAGERIVQKVLEQGEEYFSDNVSLDGTLYYGYYVPVYQKGGTSPVGMVFAGTNKEETLREVMKIIYSIIFIVVLVMLACILVAVLIASSITGALKKSIVSVQEVSSGKLNVEIGSRILNRSDAVGDLARSIMSLQSELRKMIGGIRESSHTLLEESDSLEQTAHQTYENISNVKNVVDAITEGANRQAEDARNASENVKHMGNLITEAGREADDLNESADTMKCSGDKASVTIEELKKISQEVKEAVVRIADQTRQTNESAGRIKEASDFISEIASETNLLSLNASIEAARAGEAGRGFSVVAMQIQKLAEQSNEASGSIDEIVNTLIENSQLVVDTMVHMQEIVEKQNVHIASTGETVDEVMQEIETSVQKIKSIENKTKELEKARTEIIDMISSLADIAEDNVTSTRETNGAIKEVADSFRNVEESAENLRNTADQLVQNMSSFQLQN